MRDAPSLNLVDIRDTAGDRKAGLSTLPAVLGAPATATLLAVLLTAVGADYAYKGDLPAALFSAGLAAFSIYSFKPRGRLYYEWGLAAMNMFMAGHLARLILMR